MIIGEMNKKCFDTESELFDMKDTKAHISCALVLLVCRF